MATKKVSVKVIGFSTRKENAKVKDYWKGKLTPKNIRDPKVFVSIKDSCPLLEVKYPMYASRLLKEGKIEGVKLLIGKLEKWYVYVPSITYYKENKSVRTGMRRFLLRTPIENFEKVKEALDALDIEYTLEEAYKAKKGAKKRAPKEPSELEITGIEF